MPATLNGKSQVGDASQASVLAIKAVTDLIPDAGAMTDIGTDTARLTAARAQVLTDWINGGRLDLLLDAIKAVTDALPDSGALTSISDETDKIDGAVTDGLAGVNNSLAYRVHEIEKHLHSRGRFWGAVAVPDETDAIEANVNRPFAATSGNNTWGTAIPICGTDDVPVSSGLVKFDAHRLLISDLDADTTPWRIRFIYGTGTSADAITAEQWSEEMVEANAVPGNRAGGTPLDFQMPRINVGTKLWAQVWNDTNGEVMSFFWGAHGYAG